MAEEVQCEVRGRDMVSGLPKTVVLTSEEIRQVLEWPLSHIITAVKETLDHTPPELLLDIRDRGIMLAGGGSLLQGLNERLREETQMPCHLVESPLACVAVGAGRSLEEFEVIHRANQNSKSRPRATASPRGLDSGGGSDQPPGAWVVPPPARSPYVWSPPERSPPPSYETVGRYVEQRTRPRCDVCKDGMGKLIYTDEEEAWDAVRASQEMLAAGKPVDVLLDHAYYEHLCGNWHTSSKRYEEW